MSLREAYELIRDEEHWCQGSMWTDAAGNRVSYGPQAVRFCASGALAVGSVGKGETLALTKAALALFPDSRRSAGTLGPVVWVNDVLGHEAVLQCFEKAIVELEGSL